MAWSNDSSNEPDVPVGQELNLIILDPERLADSTLKQKIKI